MTLPDTREMIRALVAEPSVSSPDPRLDQSNLGVIHLLAQWLENLGFRIHLQPVTPNKSNLIATLGPEGETKGLVLSGHTDTVPFDEGLWSHDPFSLTEKDGRLYGLGSADMKSFFALALEATRTIDSQRLRQPIIIVATCDEESTMSGAQSLERLGLPAGRYAVIGEPTSLQPVRMHKGVMMETIHVHGHSGHASNPELGANALEGMVSVLQNLLLWRDQLAQMHHPEFQVPYPTLNLGAIHGGDSPNRICGHCRAHLDFRLLPGMSVDQLREALQHKIKDALRVHPKLKARLEPLFDGVPPFETPASAEIVQLCESLSGETAKAVSFATEAPFLTRLGLETIVMGPGSIDQAHQPNEYLPVSHIEPAVHLIRQLIEKLCLP